MAERKTQPNAGDVTAFLDAVPDEGRRADAQAVVALMRAVTGAEPVMWGSAIVGFGEFAYPNGRGQVSDWFVVGLSPRKAALTLYGLTFEAGRADLLERLGKHTTGKGCLYLKRTSDIDLAVLEELIRLAWDEKQGRGHPSGDA